ncbi:metallopeptidase family protein [Parvibacter caecicola]|uniref:metallopeptidase family protein n=1 Tax=Parvibacter caecicola TaxID=747645 RepID=UPI00249CCE2E|nr:metallopeptidase family protein [Parvibacter caecicola]
MDKLTGAEFEAMIEEALDAIPDKFLEALQNIVVVWEEEPNAYHLGEDFEGSGDGPGGAGMPEGCNGEESAWGEGGGEEGWPDEAEPLAAADGDWDDEPWGTWCNDELLGLFDGLSLEESCGGQFDDLPNVITIFKGPHERCFSTREEMVEEVGKTVIHELGHYFGLDDDALYAMGY